MPHQLRRQGPNEEEEEEAISATAPVNLDTPPDFPL